MVLPAKTPPVAAILQPFRPPTCTSPWTASESGARSSPTTSSGAGLPSRPSVPTAVASLWFLQAKTIPAPLACVPALQVFLWQHLLISDPGSAVSPSLTPAFHDLPLTQLPAHAATPHRITCCSLHSSRCTQSLPGWLTCCLVWCSTKGRRICKPHGSRTCVCSMHCLAPSTRRACRRCRG